MNERLKLPAYTRRGQYAYRSVLAAQLLYRWNSMEYPSKHGGMVKSVAKKPDSSHKDRLTKLNMVICVRGNWSDRIVKIGK